MIAPVLPSIAALAPALAKLEGKSGSIILVAIQLPDGQNFARVSHAWLARDEAKALRAALVRCRAKRLKAAIESTQC